MQAALEQAMQYKNMKDLVQDANNFTPSVVETQKVKSSRMG